MAGNVVSAAVISGELIIGLDDGSIIRAGYVQGPQGLKGDRGPMGATGSRGTDGNTIHTVKGPPPADLGTEGDYAINNRDWFIFGPKASGLWGAGQSMLPKNIAPIEAGKGGTTATGGGGGSGSGGSSGPIYTNTVQLTAPTRTLLSSTTGYRVLPPAGSGKQNQQDANRWAFGEVFDSIDQAIPVHTGELPPPTMPGFIDVYDGRLWFKTLNDENRLYIYNDSEWVPCTDTPPVTIGDTPPSDAAEGELWWNSSADEMTLYVYYTSPDGTSRWTPAAPPVSLDGINTTIATALEVQTAILERLDTGEAAQNTLQDTVANALDVQSTLENRVQALEGTVVDGVWKYGIRAWPQNPGEFDLIDVTTNKTTVWQDATTLRLYNTDVSGKVYTFNEVNVSDFIRIGAPGSSAVYRAMSAARPQGDYTEFLVEIVTHEDQAYEGILNYNFEFLPAFDATAYATIQYVDAQDDLDVKLATANEVTTGFRIKSDGNTLISTGTAGELALYHVKDPSNGNAEWAATKGYVDDNFINIAGQTDLDPQLFKIRQPNSEGNFRSFINIHDGEMNLYNVADPSGSGHEKWAANKEYVDSKVATTVDGLATEEYVDTEVAKVTGQTQTFWYYASHQTAENLQPGEFFVSDINEHLYLHTTSANGVDLSVGSSERVFNIATLFSVHATNGNSMYCAKSDRINFGSGSNNYMRVAQDTVFFRQQLNQGTKYVLNIPGFTP